MAVTIYTSDFILYKLRTIVVQINCIKLLVSDKTFLELCVLVKIDLNL